MLRNLKALQYASPTLIQQEALPVILSGRDLIGTSKTGSGKTAAFVLPMLFHILAQPKIEKGDGPIAVLLAPTRELVTQIVAEAKKLANGYGIE